MPSPPIKTSLFMRLISINFPGGITGLIWAFGSSEIGPGTVPVPVSVDVFGPGNLTGGFTLNSSLIPDPSAPTFFADGDWKTQREFSGVTPDVAPSVHVTLTFKFSGGFDPAPPIAIGYSMNAALIFFNKGRPEVDVPSLEAGFQDALLDIPHRIGFSVSPQVLQHFIVSDPDRGKINSLIAHITFPVAGGPSAGVSVSWVVGPLV